jgi:signal peptidase I
MSWIGWILFFILLQVIHAAGTWKMYTAAGRKGWEAIVPLYNAVIFLKILNRPWWYVFLLFLPVVNIVIFIVIWVEALRSFGFNKPKDTFLVIITLGLYLYYVNYFLALKHIENRDLHPRTAAGEWTSSILFAIVAATIVHTYAIQPFIIPTPSLEKTLLTGDFLLVSKLHYGPRFPMTTVALPMVHDTIPIASVKSYLDNPQLPYLRLPGYSSVQRNDIVVFNWPVDTINSFPVNDGKYHYKPIDKKSNYVKRCVGIAGDTLSIINGDVHINGVQLKLSDRARLQHSYYGVTDGTQIDEATFPERFNITDGVQQGVNNQTGENAIFIAAATNEAAAMLRKEKGILNLNKSLKNTDFWDRSKFPFDSHYPNNNDNMEPFLIPAKGMTTGINYHNIAYYKEILETYEGSEIGLNNTVELRGKAVLLNGKPLTIYTFKQNYYWLMGDNRHNSLDSRAWGYVPYSHVVGKPVFIWLSYDPNKGFPSGLRSERVFTTVNGAGKPISYFLYFVIALVLYFGISAYFRKKKGNKKS